MPIIKSQQISADVIHSFIQQTLTDQLLGARHDEHRHEQDKACSHEASLLLKETNTWRDGLTRDVPKRKQNRKE